MGHDSRKTIERMRPILQAMERSIDAARNRRVASKTAETPAPTSPARLAITRPASPAPRTPPTQSAIIADPDAPPRLKARPKRSAPGMYTGVESDYQSRAS